MEKTPNSISLSCNNDDGVPEATGMEKVLSDLNALKKLYGLLQQLDETSRALLKKLLDDATRQALLKQANALVTASDAMTPFSLGLASPNKMDQGTSSSSSFLNNKEAEMEQILSELQALTRLYMLLHKGPADENLDEPSKALLMKILEDATQEAVRRQAKMLSGSQVPSALERKLSTRSDCRTQHADPRLRPMVLPRPSLLASERPRQINLQHSTVSSRSGLHVDGHQHVAEEPPLARLASKSSARTALPAHHHVAEELPLARLASKSRTALPARHRPSQEEWHSSLSLHRSAVPGTSQNDTVTGGTRLANRWDSIRRRSGRGDRWSPERSSNSSWRSVSSLEPTSSLHGRATPRHVGTESSSSMRHFERLDSGLSASMTSRHGMEHVRRSVATPERSSSSKSSNTMATIQSRIRPSNNLRVERSRRRSTEEGRTSRERQRHVSDVSSTDMYNSSVSSGTMATIQSRIRPSNNLHVERSRRRPTEEGRTSREKQTHVRHFSDVSSADMYSSSVSRGSRSSSVTASPLSASTSPRTSPAPRAFAPPYYSTPVTAPRGGVAPPVYAPKTTPAPAPAPRAFATPYYSPPVTAPRGVAPPVYAPKVSRSMRRRHRQEILEKRVARLRILKDKIAAAFHHHHNHDDHHRHHHLRGSQEPGPSSRSIVVHAAGNLSSPWQYVTSMFHHVKGKVKDTARSRTVAGAPEKRRSGGAGGGNMLALFGAVRRHLKGKRTAPAGIKLKRKASRSRARAKKMHWWQQLRRGRGVAGVLTGSRPRHRLGHGKAGWL